MSESAIENSASIPQFSMLRGLLNALLFGAVGGAIPFLMLLFQINYKYRHFVKYPGYLYDEFSLQADAIVLDALGVSSILVSVAISSFSFKPALNIRRNFVISTWIPVLSTWIYGAIQGPRYKGMPSFGETWTDRLVLILPAYLAGMVLVIHQLLKGNRLDSI